MGTINSVEICLIFMVFVVFCFPNSKYRRCNIGYVMI